MWGIGDHHHSLSPGGDGRCGAAPHPPPHASTHRWWWEAEWCPTTPPKLRRAELLLRLCVFACCECFFESFLVTAASTYFESLRTRHTAFRSTHNTQPPVDALNVPPEQPAIVDRNYGWKAAPFTPRCTAPLPSRKDSRIAHTPNPYIAYYIPRHRICKVVAQPKPLLASANTAMCTASLF